MERWLTVPGSLLLLLGVAEELVVCHEPGANDPFCDLGPGIIVSSVIPNGSTHPSTKHVRVGPIGGAEGDIGVFVEVVGGPPVGSGRHELDISDFGQLFGRVRHEPDQQSNSVVHLIR